MCYKVEADFNYKGYRCVVLFTPMGHRCGYVGINKAHPLYGVNYGTKLSWLLLNDDTGIGKRGVIPLLFNTDKLEDGASPEIYFDVHGSITYSNKDNEYPVKSKNLWWFGFDCAHAGDKKDYDNLLKYNLKNEEDVMMERSWGLDYGEIRTQEYIEQECRNLVDQLIEVAELKQK